MAVERPVAPAGRPAARAGADSPWHARGSSPRIAHLRVETHGLPSRRRPALLHPSPKTTYAERLRAGGGPLTTSDREVVAALGQASRQASVRPATTPGSRTKPKLPCQTASL